jgi:hypothetical protein
LGGYLSRLHLGEVTAIQLDATPMPGGKAEQATAIEKR